MRHYHLHLLAAAAVVLLSGCDKQGPLTDAEEEKVPLVTSGQLYMEQGNYDEAINAFKQAINETPMIARPHLDLAEIYKQYKINYFHAMYHYDRYLELRPDTEKAEMIQEQRLNIAKALANTFINNSAEVKKVIQERNDLIQMNADLKRQLSIALQAQQAAETKLESAKTTPTKSVTQTVPKKANPTATAQTTTAAPQQPVTNGKHQIYHVVSGDTLTKIATKFYNDSGKWDIIFDANRDSMKSARDLRVGQTLVIPAIGN